jgi:ABC-type multidrug transport system ATPase subunit
MRIEARGLVKIFPAPLFSGGAPLRALNGLDLEAGPGVLGVEGPNGSGKTTLFKTLAGIIEADGGTILAGGAPVSSAALRKHAAYCPANPRSFYFRLSAAENLRFFGALAGLPPAEAAGRAERLAERLGLSQADLARRFDRLSEGNMQKVSLLRAFSRRPALLLLDEPFRGLDAQACRGLLELIAEAGRGEAVIISSHSPDLLRQAAARIIKLEGGRLQEAAR